MAFSICNRNSMGINSTHQTWECTLRYLVINDDPFSCELQECKVKTRETDGM